MANQFETGDKQLDLARAAVAGTVFYGHVERDGGEWVISGLVDASPGAGVMMEHESGARQEPAAVREPRFSDALDLAIEAGMCEGLAKEKFEQLLVSWGVERF
jgi:hypothetical protein